MSRMHKIIGIFLFVAVLPLCYFATPSFALKEDHSQRMIILSDSTLYDNKTGTTVFEGHVKVTQGSTLIIADRLTTKTGSDHKINEIIAYGTTKVAEYWTLPNADEPPFHASANIIKYHPKDPDVTLEQNVTATQGKNSFHGGVIHYNRLTETLNVPASSGGQAVLIYTEKNSSL